MQDFLVLAFILVAVAIGFGVGRLTVRKPGVFGGALFDSQASYVKGLTYLLKDQADASLDAFISRMEVGPETLELHLSLGALLRRKGEFSRAVKVHENLLSHTGLDIESRLLVQFELAQDYASSGLLDRAEILFLALVDHSSIGNVQRRAALEKLLGVYQEIQEWLKAIDIADRLTEKKFSPVVDKWGELKAHFACELAELGRSRKELDETRKWARAALSYDSNCARATLMIAAMDIDEKRFPAAIASLKMIPLQSPAHGSEMLEPLIFCFHALQKQDQLVKELQAYLDICPDPYAFKDLIARVRVAEGDRKALEVFERNADKFPSFNKVFKLASQLSKMTDVDEQSMATLVGLAEEMMDCTRSYRCRDCGFSAHQMHWLCPSCKHWASLAIQY